MIAVESLSKTFKRVNAVRDLSFVAESGKVTGFLGPNGAGKTTTLRMLLGLVRPTSGTALIDGREYASLERPAAVVGSALEASDFHPGRTGLDHLRVYAPLLGVSDARCHEALAQVGLSEAADRRVLGYSLGMRQRLALAFALLGDPPVLILDEPANGLDPEGIVWLRRFLRALADEGRTVLVSSHVLAEVQATVDDVVIIARGQLVHASSLTDLRQLAGHSVVLRSPDTAAVERMLAAQGWESQRDDGAWILADTEVAEVGAAAFAGGVELHELSAQTRELEDVFLQLTREGDDEEAKA